MSLLFSYRISNFLSFICCILFLRRCPHNLSDSFLPFLLIFWKRKEKGRIVCKVRTPQAEVNSPGNLDPSLRHIWTNVWVWSWVILWKNTNIMDFSALHLKELISAAVYGEFLSVNRCCYPTTEWQHGRRIQKECVNGLET